MSSHYDVDSDSAHFEQFNIAAVVPAYNEARHIADVLHSLPSYIRTVIVVDDASTDETADRVAEIAAENSAVVLVRHEKNQGVGGAMITGFKKALELGAQIVVKFDGDSQMSPEFLPGLLRPLISGEADYTKGNRFRDFRALNQMPAIRRAGNMALSFLTKAAVGYWDCFDPCNGFIAIRGDILAEIPLHKLQKSFFFETSMLAQLYLLDASVRDVPMPARYGKETTHLSILKVLGEFPGRLLRCFLRRLVLKNFVYGFSMETIYLLSGLPLLVMGTLYGGINWYHVWGTGETAPTGTVVISAMLIILGFQLLLSAVGEDLRSGPREPLCRGPLAPMPHRADAADRTAERSTTAPPVSGAVKQQVVKE